MSRKRVIALIAVLVLGVAFAGCLQAGDDAPDEPDALHTAAVDDMTEADSYTMSMESETTMTVDGETVEQGIDASGVVDQNEQRLYMEQRIEAGQGLGNQTVETYVLGESAYASQGGAWQSVALPTDPWEQPTAQGQVQLLEDADVTRVGNETVDGVETAVFEVDASSETFEEAAKEQLGGFGSLLDAISIEDATVHQYVAVEEPHYVYRVDTEMTMRFDGGSGQSQEIETDQTMRFDDFEEDVSVDVPEDLQERHES